MKNKKTQASVLTNLSLNNSVYALEGLSFIKKFAKKKFDESVEAHILLNIQNDKSKNFRITFELPYNIIKPRKIAVLCASSFENQALTLGASIAGLDSLLSEISKKKLDFDILITTPQLMSKLTPFAKILGPKKLIPSIQSGTLSSNLEDAIKDFARGKFESKTDKEGILHIRFGKASFLLEHLSKNLNAIIRKINSNKPEKTAGRFIKSIYLCSSMGSSVKLNLNNLLTELN